MTSTHSGVSHCLADSLALEGPSVHTLSDCFICLLGQRSSGPSWSSHSAESEKALRTRTVLGCELLCAGKMGRGGGAEAGFTEVVGAPLPSPLQTFSPLRQRTKETAEGGALQFRDYFVDPIPSSFFLDISH